MPHLSIAPESSISTSGAPGSMSIPLFQNEGNAARQGRPQTFVFGSNADYQGWFNRSVSSLEQPLFGAISITYPVRLTADGIHLTTNGNSNDSNNSVSTGNPRANFTFGLPTPQQWSRGLNVLAQRERPTNSTASSPHLKV